MTTNIINDETGVRGYQVAGAPLQKGWSATPDMTIDASAIKNPVKSISIPTTTPTVPYAGAVAHGEALQKDAEKQAEANIKAANDASGLTATQGAQTDMLSKIKSLLGMQSAAQTEVSQSTQPKLDQANTELTGINTLIADTNVKLRGEQDAIKSRGDITSTAQQGLMGNVNEKYGRTLADLAIRQSAANGNIMTLQANAKYALEQKLAPIQTELSYYKDFLSQNLDSLSKTQQAQAQNIIAEKQRLLDKVAAEHKIMTDAITEALKNGVKVPDQAIAEAQNDPTNTASIFAKYGISLQDPLDVAVKKEQILKSQADRAKIYAEIKEKGSTVNITRRGPDGQPLPATATDKALQVILGSGKFTKEQVKLITNSINNGEDPFTIIKNQGKALMTGANQTKVESYETARQGMTDLKTALAEFYANGGKTNYLSGKWENVINKLGEVKDPKLVELATQIQTQLQVYRNAVSGTAYSVQEGADIASIFPGINKSKGLNDSIISGREAAFNSTIDGAYKGVLGSAYEEMKKANTKTELVTPVESKKIVDDFIRNNPLQLPSVIQLYNVPGTTDSDVLEYLKLKGLVK